jgi:hypothetical protein
MTEGITFFLKTARNRIFFAEWFASDNLKSYFSFMQLPTTKNYFASDQHFGAPTPEFQKKKFSMARRN